MGEVPDCQTSQGRSHRREPVPRCQRLCAGWRPA